MNRLKAIALGSAFLSFNLCLSSLAVAQEQERRLIKYGSGSEEVAWLSETEIDRLSQKAHDEGHCGGFMDITQHPYKRNRAPIPVRTLPGTITPSQPDVVNALLAELSAQNIENNVATLSNFQNRYYRSETGAAAAHWIRDRFTEYASGRSDITVELFTHQWAQPSVVARIQGRNPLLATETVIIGGHEDSINQSIFNNSVAPGADDNASGTSTVLEVFRVIAQSGYQPERTIEFMTYAGEERGLLGSQDIAERYRSENRAVVGVMQFDMTMYPGRTRRITFINDHTNPQLTQFAKQLIDTYVQFPWTDSRCGYACSDHASWTDAGYASVFPFESPSREMNPNIHTTDDLLNILDPDFGLQFAKLGVAFAVELSAQNL